jgi:mRNA-degrading endonuclease toxin of MazEF toxin-antitoxin module
LYQIKNNIMIDYIRAISEAIITTRAERVKQASLREANRKTREMLDRMFKDTDTVRVPVGGKY